MENDHLADAILWLEGVLECMRDGLRVDPEDIERAIREIKMEQDAHTAGKCEVKS